MKDLSASRRRSAPRSAGATDRQRTNAGTVIRPKSGLVPSGDVRLTANIRSDLHLALKIRAARERTTMGELIEQWVQTWKGDD